MPRSADPIQLALSDAIRKQRATGELLEGLTVSKQRDRPRARYVTKGHATPETATLPITWSLANAATIVNQLEQVSRLIEQGYALRQAVDTLQTISASKEGQYQWSRVYEAWKQKQGFSVESGKKYDGWFSRMHKLLRSHEYPVRNGKTLMRQYERAYLQSQAFGSDGRYRPLRFFSNLINYAIAHHGLHEEWAVPDAFRLEIVGKKEGSKDRRTPPIESPQLLQLLDDLEQSYPDIFCMCGLMAYHGLMGSELAVLIMTPDGLETAKSTVYQVLPKKRKPRHLESIDTLAREGHGDSISKRWASGLLSLPTQVENAIARCFDTPYTPQSPNYKAVGDAVRQVLDRNEHWQALVDQNPEITPYSLRHSFAWRCHKELNMESSMVAPWMGHTVEVHNQHYNAWFTRETQQRYKAEMIAMARERARLASENDCAVSHGNKD